jgi:PhzF family phenazine biosynthesis protein
MKAEKGKGGNTLMNKQKQYTVDAFTDQVFAGNPAAVCILKEWLPDDVMAKIAMEKNYSETAFAVENPEHSYHLRWFTPGGEVKLCGHATLATGYVLLSILYPERTEVSFQTLSGTLKVSKNGDLLTMDFPAYSLKKVPVTDAMAEAIGGFRPVEAYMGDDLVCVMASEDQVRQA